MKPATRKDRTQAWGPRAMRSPQANRKRYDPNGENILTGKGHEEGDAQSGSSIDHGSLTGLLDDDHTQYAKTSGRSGGQTIQGGNAASQNLTLESTAHATKGKIILGSASAYDQANDRLGIGTTSPSVPLEVPGAVKFGAVSNSTGLAAGTYTPTRSAEANLDSSVTMSEAQWLRVGNTVTVSGCFTADPTTTLTTTSFEITLPVASNIGAVEDVAGVAAAGGIASMSAAIFGSVANDTAKIQWIATDVTSQAWSYTFSYQVI